MTNSVYEEYRRLFNLLRSSIDSVLEVGALPNKNSLLNAPELSEVSNKVGVNLSEYGKYKDVEVLQADARKLPFPSESFDLVVCSSTLEHIPNFWLACDEMKRVLKQEGSLIINVPGFIRMPIGDKLRGLAKRARLNDFFRRTTFTVYIHDAPYDYYRFSIYSMREIVMNDLEIEEIWSVMNPPRIFGWGRKK